MRRLLGACLLPAACIALPPNPASGAERFRTPAEVELRRAAIEARLVLLADEQMLLEAALVHAVEAGAPPGETAVPESTHARIEALLARVAEERAVLAAEARELAGIVTRTATGPVTQADPQGLAPAQIPGGASQVSAGNAFNPAITIIPDGLYRYDNADGDAGARFRHAEGFDTPGAEIESEDPARGFSLREVELALSGAVDPYFDVWATFGISEDGIETEEAYVQTRRLLPGMQVRFGQFLSGVGYLNRQHRHQWDFVDRALPYEVLFGPALREVGVQVTWLPALPVYAQLGFEALQGDNPAISNQLAERFPNLLEETPGPRLFTGFVKVAPELGYSNTLQAGFSAGRSRSHQEAVAFRSRTDVFDGTAWFIGTDAVWRYDSPRPYGHGDLTIQGEYIYRSRALTLVRASNVTEAGSRQDGLYAQAVYGVGPRWTTAGRVEVVGLRNQVTAAAGTLDLASTTRYAANATFNPTEFSRLRVQYNYGRPAGSTSGRVHEVYVQFQMSLGVHGAHMF